MRYWKIFVVLSLVGVFVCLSQQHVFDADDKDNDGSELLTVNPPIGGTSIHPGEHFVVNVSIKPGSRIKTVYLAGKGIDAGLGPKVGPPFSFDVIAPNDVSAKISIVAVGSTQLGQLGSIMSKPIIVDVTVNNDDACILN